MKRKTKSSSPIEYDYLKASSAQDCTGLIPRGIEDESEIESYKNIYPFLPKTVLPEDDSSK